MVPWKSVFVFGHKPKTPLDDFGGVNFRIWTTCGVETSSGHFRQVRVAAAGALQSRLVLKSLPYLKVRRKSERGSIRREKKNWKLNFSPRISLSFSIFDLHRVADFRGKEEDIAKKGRLDDIVHYVLHRSTFTLVTGVRG